MINGKELMIGDYVNFNTNGTEVVLGIVKEIRDEGEQLTVSVNGDKVFDTCADEDICSIKLSEEFFLKNGFKELCRTEYSIRLYNSDLYLRVKITPENHFTCNHIDINYVHEFQHYLRLVNLSDYANNLKI